MLTQHTNEVFLNERLSKSEVNEILYGIYKLKLSRYENHISTQENVEDIEHYENKIKRLQNAWSEFNRNGQEGEVSIVLKSNLVEMNFN